MKKNRFVKYLFDSIFGNPDKKDYQIYINGIHVRSISAGGLDKEFNSMEKFVFGDMVRFIPTGELLVFIKMDKNGVNAKLVDADGKHRTACSEDIMGRETERPSEYADTTIYT
jgi:hypothetical protein